MSALPPRHILSKSTFVRGCQCVKSLWLYKNHYKLRDEPTAQQQRILMQGTDVGLLARQLFGRGADASPTDVFHYRESVRDTARLIAEGNTIIFEAAFQYEGVLCAVDILIKHRGKWYAYEVKSSTGLKDQFIQDAALQYYVITNAGLELEDIFLVHINTGYVRSGDLQLKQLFIKHSVKEQVVIMQPFIATKAAELKLVTIQKHLPNIEIGTQCNIPYTCDYYGLCHKEDPMFQNNSSSVLGDADDSDKIIILDPPVHFLYIGTYRVAVPEHDGHWPYRHIPYQYSFITINNNEQTEDHFIATYEGDPIIQFVEKFKSIAEDEGPIFVSKEKFMQARIAELQRDYPNYVYELDLIKCRLKEIKINNNIDNIRGAENINNAQKMLISNEEDAAALWYNNRQQPIEVVNSVEPGLKEFSKGSLKSLINKVQPVD